LDDKQRLLLPKTVKNSLQMSEEVFLTPGNDQCLELHTSQTIALRSAEVTESSAIRRKKKSYARLFFAQAQKCELDSQNRIRVTHRLVEWAQLETRVVILGVGAYWEIWDEALWRAYCQLHEADFDQLSDSLAGKGRSGICEEKPTRETEIPNNPR
jgi:MraZ protein